MKPGEKRKLTEEQRIFVKTLNAELQKFNKFFMNAEEDFVIKDSMLERGYREVVNKDGTRAESFTMKKYRKSCKDFADFHGELVLMEHWVSLNYTALVKILKKHDKRSNLSLRSPFLVSVLQQPFYSTEVLTELIKKTESRFRVLHALASETEAAAREKNGAREPEKNAAPSRLATTPAALARTRAAISCWDGMKHEDSVKRPFGDISASAEHPAPASKKVRA